jgi:peptidoglycan/xylan/chitin deacetylase (PgdA/CDA1 family)
LTHADALVELVGEAPRDGTLTGMREESGSAAVALSFDDGPDPDVTTALLDMLAELEVRASFFPISSRAREHPEIVARMLEEGHAVGLHGAFHLKHSIYPDDLLAADTRLALKWLGHEDVRLWRPPHGIATETTRRLAAEHGLVLQGWSLSSADWIEGHTSEQMFERLAPRLRAGGVIDMHDAIGPGKRAGSPSLRSSCQPTLELIPRLVEEIRARELSLDAIVAPPPSRNALLRSPAAG